MCFFSIQIQDASGQNENAPLVGATDYQRGNSRSSLGR